MPERNLSHRPNYGASGMVVQHSRLLYSRLAVHNPTVILVLSGRKILRWAGNELVIPAGRAVALSGWQTFDVLNEPDGAEGLPGAMAVVRAALNRRFGSCSSMCA